ncbi:hypothetical protein OIO90_001126 [Microbotryomycetes sp. JL221]|nr:hypothetical protein OIO90_001126 [Microbotryomycetes sp. JL221]
MALVFEYVNPGRGSVLSVGTNALAHAHVQAVCLTVNVRSVSPVATRHIHNQSAAAAVSELDHALLKVQHLREQLARLSEENVKLRALVVKYTLSSPGSPQINGYANRHGGMLPSPLSPVSSTSSTFAAAGAKVGPRFSNAQQASTNWTRLQLFQQQATRASSQSSLADRRASEPTSYPTLATTETSDVDMNGTVTEHNLISSAPDGHRPYKILFPSPPGRKDQNHLPLPKLEKAVTLRTGLDANEVTHTDSSLAREPRAPSMNNNIWATTSGLGLHE